MIERKRRKDGVTQNYHVKPRKLVDVLGLPDLRALSIFPGELAKKYPVAVRQGTRIITGGVMKNPGASNFKDMFEDKPNVQINTKKLYHVGHLKDLFRYGKHIKILNGRGMVVREAKMNGAILLDPKSGNPQDILKLAPEIDILYEPWWEDYGSFLFVAPPNTPPGLRGKLLKIGIESDMVISK